MFNKDRLKPLGHKKNAANGVETMSKPVPLAKLKVVDGIKGTKQPHAKHDAKIQSQTKRSSSKIVVPHAKGRVSTMEQYDCDDFQCELDDNPYFEQQLERNSRAEVRVKPQAKTQILLPKLQGDVKAKNVKDLEREMDEQMARMFELQSKNPYE